jgi:hypothetical protein
MEDQGVGLLPAPQPDMVLAAEKDMFYTKQIKDQLTVRPTPSAETIDPSPLIQRRNFKASRREVMRAIRDTCLRRR